jgi:DnaJ like chaperone protein
MAIWARVGEFLAKLGTDAFSSVTEAVRTAFSGDAETRKQVAFSIAMIALSAKMAKADGIVTAHETEAFRDIFHIPEKEANRVYRLYNFAKQDVAGFESYARQVRTLFGDDDLVLKDVMDGLFHIAKADGVVHQRELEFLDRVAELLDISGKRYQRIRMRHLGSGDGDAWFQLAADPAWDNETLKKHYRELVRENHPDRLVGRGVPAEFVAIATERLASINHAWDIVRAERGI